MLFLPLPFELHPANLCALYFAFANSFFSHFCLLSMFFVLQATPTWYVWGSLDIGNFVLLRSCYVLL